MVSLNIYKKLKNVEKDGTTDQKNDRIESSIKIAAIKIDREKIVNKN